MKDRFFAARFWIFCALAVSLAGAAFAAPTEIKYAFWGNPDAIGVEKDIIDAFEASHPDIKVTPIAIAYSDYQTKLQVMIAGGQAPDVMRIDSYWFQDFMKFKALKDISDQVKTSKFDTSKLYPVGLQDCQVDGRLYGLPWATAPLYMLINTKMFADAHIPLPKANWTYDQFLDIAKKISKGEGENQVWGFGYFLPNTNGFASILPFVWGAGGDLFDAKRSHFTLNTPAVEKRLDELLVTNVKNQAFTSPFLFQKQDDLTKYFSQNKIAMYTGAASEILTLQKIDGFDFQVLPMPGTAQFPRVTISKSNIVGISATTKVESAAWAFLSFLRGPEGEKLYMKAKRMPPNYDDQQYWDLYVDAKKPPVKIKDITQTIAVTYGRPLPLRSSFLEIQDIVIGALQNVVAGRQTSAQALDSVAPKVQALLDK